MNVSVKGEYALQAIFDLSTHPGSEPVRIADIAKRQNIPQKFLELILSSLKQAGFVESRRGAEGGYLLARPSNTITVGEVLRFIEGKSSRSATQGRRRDVNLFADLWRQVDQAISGVVDHTTFADLAREWKDRQAQYVPNWDI